MAPLVELAPTFSNTRFGLSSTCPPPAACSKLHLMMYDTCGHTCSLHNTALEDGSLNWA
eukprot:CAMPEP_0198549192 /NCGR_PEP_ID=MMETSP1462-20131121/72125_1 /TAXON_ID=1333877 /ORGANISM="Brandtodinium nutriculum, Strain RCC3387" /LENGTH=58 /DNA_ID=CAMNT_0044279757 /DNA_START=205 /DNA_END=381 /DNA_ORIENTATION=-